MAENFPALVSEELTPMCHAPFETLYKCKPHSTVAPFQDQEAEI